MKKTAAIISLYGNSNYGNKLQNYAVQEVLRREGIDSVNIINVPCLNNKSRDISAVLKMTSSLVGSEMCIRDRLKEIELKTVLIRMIRNKEKRTF